MYMSELSNNSYKYFQDSNHAYDTTYECISNELMKKESNCVRTKIIFTDKNINQKLQELKILNQIN